MKTKLLLSFGKNVIFFHDVYSYMPKLEACANKTYTGVSLTNTCRDRPKLKTKLLLSFGKNAIFFHDVYSYMPKLEACAKKNVHWCLNN